MLNRAAWRGRYWARKSGWIAFKVNGEEQLWAYISDETAFEALRQETRRKETLKIIQQDVAQDADETKKIEHDATPMLWCALCLMLTLGGLWIERKL